jgi:DNA (cytosine-5)-methyltransferase 1
MTSFELFTGAGGLALGIAAAEFEHVGLAEWNRDACASLRSNAERIPAMRGWPIHEGDVRELAFSRWAGRVNLLAAGAPCQPFSLGGKHRGYRDDRNMFPEVFRATRELWPEMVVIENVKGLLRKSFRDYFEYIELQLSLPEFSPEEGEDWRQHKARLSKLLESPPRDALRYVVRHQLLNAADFGVPQRRERVFITAFRSDLGVRWKGLRPTHTQDALLHAQYVTGTYWEEHGLDPLPCPDRFTRRVNRLAQRGPDLFDGRWRTVWDAVHDLPQPVDGQEYPGWHGHVGQRGAKIYPGHTGSPLHEPAKTLKAGAHGVPGGENMLRRHDGSVRYFTVRESARLQTFPDDYHFKGAWGEAMRQLGNAVPVDLGRAVAGELMRIYDSAREPLVARVA